MPRDSSGNYTLPAGNPVVSGTTIETLWGNGTMNDLASALTNSLDRTGNGAMLAPLPLADGTRANPALAFSSEPGLGFYRAGAQDLRLASANSDIALFSGAGLSIISTAAAATVGPRFEAYRNSPTPAVNDLVGALELSGNNALLEKTVYGSVESRIEDVTDGSEDGVLVLRSMFLGSLRNAMEITSTTSGAVTPTVNSGTVAIARYLGRNMFLTDNAASLVVQDSLGVSAFFAEMGVGGDPWRVAFGINPIDANSEFQISFDGDQGHSPGPNSRSLIESLGNTILTLMGGDNDQVGFWLGDDNDPDNGGVIYDNGAQQLILRAGGSAKMSLAFNRITLDLTVIPTSDPGLPGQIWRSGNALQVSI